ncbi:hypothetical protein ACFYUD_21490 [Nocardia tengchongensis]|uniref:hypothetical protein n=1 Tax=Nocardia tengchongensis TaxID=2055889 RepID=UPI0036762FD9
MLATLAVENYRSLRTLRVPLGRTNVVTGANGSGKSSELVKQEGATTVTGQEIMDEPLWYWPDR